MDKAQPLAFGDLLRQFREAANLTQEGLAERARVSARAISDIERDPNRIPQRATIQRLAAALQLSDEERGILESAARRLDARSSRPTHGAAQSSGRPSTLPVQVTSFIGREQEVAAVTTLLQRPSVRLVTITGPGGVGKTRAGLRVAETVQDLFPDGVTFVDLTPVRDAALVALAINRVLGIAEEAGHTARETLIASLRHKSALLVLDNVEQLLEAAPSLVELLGACAGLKILATSRAILRVSGEQIFPLPPLALPDLAASLTADGVAQYAAVRLFVERARAVKPDFQLSVANAATVAALCARLDGLPLAIELAAARVRHLPPRPLLARLDHRLAVLGEGPRDLPERQQTLRGALAWSYDLLHPSEQALLRQLSVFMGGCTIDAANTVCLVQGTTVMNGLSVLVDNSLVRLWEPVRGEARYGMLETVREYAAEMLDTAGETETTRWRHAQHFVTLAEEAEPGMQGHDQAHTLECLEAEHDNLRAALQWAEDGNCAEDGLRLAGALWLFWQMHGHFSEGRAWLEQMLALAERDGTASMVSRAKALAGAGALARNQGDYAAAVARLESSLRLFRNLGHIPRIIAVLSNLGLAASEQGGFERAATIHEEALTLARSIGDQRGIAAALNNLGLIARERGDYERATALHKESLSLAYKLGHQAGIALVLCNLGLVLAEQGDFEPATTRLNESLHVYRALGDTHGSINVLINLGFVFIQEGRHEQALAPLEESVTLAREFGVDRLLALSLNNLADAVTGLGRYERATSLYTDALILYHTVGDRVGIAYCLEGLARSAHALGRFPSATRLLGAASALRSSLGAPLPPVERTSHDQLVTSIHTQLGEAAFAVAWAEGEALSPEQLLASHDDDYLKTAIGANHGRIPMRKDAPIALGSRDSATEIC